MLNQKMIYTIISGAIFRALLSQEGVTAETIETQLSTPELSTTQSTTEESIHEKEFRAIETEIKRIQAEIDKHDILVHYIQEKQGFNSYLKERKAFPYLDKDSRFNYKSGPSIDSIQQQTTELPQSLEWIQNTYDHLWNDYNKKELDIPRYTARSLRNDLWNLKKKLELSLGIIAPYLPKIGEMATSLMLTQRQQNLDYLNEKLESCIQPEITRQRHLMYYLNGREHECSEKFLNNVKKEGYIEQRIEKAESIFFQRLTWFESLREILSRTASPVFYIESYVDPKYEYYLQLKGKELQKAWEESTKQVSYLYARFDHLEGELKNGLQLMNRWKISVALPSEEEQLKWALEESMRNDG